MITVVIPTIGRPSLAETLAALDADLDVVVVDDRGGGEATGRGAGPRGAATPGLPGLEAAGPPVSPGGTGRGIRVVRSGGRGPAAARNAGWRVAETPWVVFLDDDVVPAPGWGRALREDLTGLPEDVGGSQGRIEVPLPEGRRPTDAERHTAGLANAEWITADMAYRRAALEATGGFDERFPRAYREDADLALRTLAAGYRLVRGRRVTRHPIRDDGPWASVRRQRGNADDALMRRVHGPGWRAAVGGGRGRLRGHALTTGLGLLSLLAGGLAVSGGRGRGTGGLRAAAAVAGAGWLALTAEFAWSRIAPGPRTTEEIGWMTVTSVLIPPVACARRLGGELRVRR
ncbi:glycosyltransferase [Streptosporangium carneum]|uniref:Glycosyltransferase 2-like domain-containing protein n=1 Tax=Streptosporangium carneum TaxID=47481 RepID=A0A9W6I302_9ACTN|nr:glycosyltransferase [Streptosporangium carneum]GLK10334.1 hypothetical protein GCM10017600_37400 [Streptosporangium carneum]